MRSHQEPIKVPVNPQLHHNYLPVLTFANLMGILCVNS